METTVELTDEQIKELIKDESDLSVYGLERKYPRLIGRAAGLPWEIIHSVTWSAVF